MKDKSIDATHHHSHNVFDNPEMFIEKFDGAERDEWQKPDEVIESFNLSDDAVVVEIGSGTGYFAVRLAEHLKNGKVIAFDQSANMTAYLENRVRKLGLTNVEVHTSAPEGNITLEEKADLIFSVDVYHHLQDRTAYFSKLASLLTPEGKLVIIDRTEEKIKGQPSGHRVSAEKAKEEMKEAGFEFVENFDFLLPVQYYLTFKLIS
jgi:cyclopropane fatty-acyl-phospholipid synthase-like methyltransferase